MSTHEHLEHAEHAEHASHNPFDRKVAMTMAIVAAGLACIVMLSHREHNETLLLQNEAGLHQTMSGKHLTNVGNYLTEADKLTTEAAVQKTEAANKWSYYQAKSIRKHEYEAYQRLAGFLAKAPGQDDEAKKAQDYWSDQVKKYKTELPEMKKEAEGLDAKARELLAKADEFKKLVKQEQIMAGEEEKKVGLFTEQSHLAHARSTRFDLGELGIELALVLCSIAVLTKRAGFWYSGMVIGVVGAVVGVSAFLTRHGDHGDGHAAPAQHAPETPGKSGSGH